MDVRSYDDNHDRSAVIDLWTRAGLVRAWNDPDKDIDRKLTVQPELFLVGTVNDDIIAVVMAGYDGHRGWINYLAVDPDKQKQGYGRTMMDAAEKRLLALGCPKINLQIRAGNDAVLTFYEAIGFVDDGVVSMGRRLIPDD